MNVLRDISVILLAAQAFFFALIPLAFFGALVYGVWWLRMHRNVPTWLSAARAYLGIGLSYVEMAMQAVAQPVIVAHRTAAKLEGWSRGLSNARRRQEGRRSP
jgi:Na+(H+)/acetate symporter ActP